MRILHISDTHGFHNEFSENKFENVDMIIHSGDCSNYRSPIMNSDEVRSFLDWFCKIPIKHKIYVAGNHDSSIENGLITPSDFASCGITYLENQSVIIENTKFYGSPYTPSFGNWSFMKARHKIGEIWKQIPEDTDVLITHGPPKGVRDLTYKREDNQLEMCGDGALLKRIYYDLPNLKAVLFGHIHNYKDINNQGISRYSYRPNTIFSNASCVEDGRYDKGLIAFGNYITI
jgi:predicted phosphodiesterase